MGASFLISSDSGQKNVKFRLQTVPKNRDIYSNFGFMMLPSKEKAIAKERLNMEFYDWNRAGDVNAATDWTLPQNDANAAPWNRAGNLNAAPSAPGGAAPFTAPAREEAAPTAEPSAPVYHEDAAPERPAGRAAKAGRYARPARRKGLGRAVVAMSLCCALLGGAVGAGGVLLLDRNTDGTAVSAAQSASTALVSGRESTELNTVRVEGGKLLTAAEVYAANVNSTVGITTEITTNYWGYQTTAAAAGSGFILTQDGYILTNQHVIDSARSITVTMYDGTAYDAELVGYDTANDIAVLKIDAEGLTPVVLGDSDNLNVGDDVVAIGNPLGELTFSLTKGAVSALNREITLSGNNTMNLIQTDCAINSGNSGGALFNLYGEVVGITNAKYSSSGSSSEASIDNIGFAIPINQVYSLVKSIIENGYISKPYVGLSVSDVSQESQSYGLPAGAAVQTVAQNSPAQAAGLQAGDIITQADDTQITGASDFARLVAASAKDDVLTLTVYRQGQSLQLTLTVGENIQSALAEEESAQQPQQPDYGGLPFGNWG